MPNIYYKKKFSYIYSFIFKNFINKIRNYSFEKIINIASNKSNFNNNLKN